MLHMMLWPVLAAWMGIALLCGGLLIGTIVWCTVHLLRDVIVGESGTIWCPSFRRAMRVDGVPRGSSEGAPFASLTRCEQWGGGRIRCAKTCLLHQPLPAG